MKSKKEKLVDGIIDKLISTFYSKKQDILLKKMGGIDPDINIETDRTFGKSIKQQVKEAFLEAGSGDYMTAYRNTLATLENAQRNRPRFANAKIYMGQSKPGMARGSSFSAIQEEDASKLIKENRTRMKDFVISKASPMQIIDII